MSGATTSFSISWKMDERSRSCPSSTTSLGSVCTSKPRTTSPAERIVEILKDLIARDGATAFNRSDNGPEIIARAVRDWLATQNIETAFIEPGSPWENAYSESFNSRFRDELLDREIFTSLLEARTLIEQHRRDYNERRPHSSLAYKTPKPFAREHQAMDSAGLWKAAEKRAFPQPLENAPHPPPPFPTATTASATG